MAFLSKGSLLLKGKIKIQWTTVNHAEFVKAKYSICLENCNPVFFPSKIVCRNIPSTAVLDSTGFLKTIRNILNKFPYEQVDEIFQ